MIRTLVVDDDFRVAAIHAAYVERIPGFEVIGQVHSAGSLAQSVARLKPDLVLLDLYLPDHHGPEVLRWLRQPSSGAGDVDVIVITAASDTESIRAAMQGGAAHYLLRPFRFPALQEELLASAAQRYLTQLRDAGRVTMTLRYGTAGRPEHRYRAREDGPAVGQGSGSSSGTPARTAAAEASSGHCSARRRATTSWR